MLSKEEFVRLYEKYIKGECTPEEIQLLNDYQDDLSFTDLDWADISRNKQQTRERIWQRLRESRQRNPTGKVRRLGWLKVAAVILMIVSAGLLFLKQLIQSHTPNSSIDRNQLVKITPGGNKAILTMANGKTILLSDVKNGRLATQAGIEVNKTKDGMLVYHFSRRAPDESNSGQNILNTITTPKGGQYQIVLSDGTKVWLNAASSLHFPVTFTGTKRTVELTGEAYFEVAKNKHMPFTVKANGTDVQVLGTHFNVSAYTDDNTVTTTLLEGSVKLYKEHHTAMLVPGQQGVTSINKAGINVQTANIEQVIAWKNGYFLFKDASIATIMKQAARWYDIDVAYVGTIKNDSYGGKISRYSNISELLKNLELTGTIHFKVEGRRVTVMQ